MTNPTNAAYWMRRAIAAGSGGGGGSADEKSFNPQNWDSISFDDGATVLRGAWNLGEVDASDSSGTVPNLVTDVGAFGDLSLPALTALADESLCFNNSLPRNAGGAGLVKLTSGTPQILSGDHTISTGPFCILAFFKLRGGVQTGASNHGFYLGSGTQCRVSTYNASGYFRLMVNSDTNEGSHADYDLAQINMLAVGRRDDNSTYSCFNLGYNGGRATCTSNFITDDISLMGGDPNSILVEFAAIEGDVSESDLANIYNEGNLTLYNAA